MSATRIIVAAVVGGLVVFIWGAVSHMVLPTGEMGIKSLPAEEALLPPMKLVIKERGFYFFPGMAQSGKDMTDAEQKAWEDKIRRGPQGVLIYDPAGSEPMSPVQLGTEFASNALASLLLAIVLSLTRVSRGGRIVLAAALGLFAWLSIDVSYWNWYRFPGAFTGGQFIDQTIGWLLGGIAIILVLGAGRVCPSCSKRLPIAAPYCGNCGSKLAPQGAGA